MNIKNYTSQIPPQKSVAQIESCLVKIGARHISKTYEDGKLAGITFQIIENGEPIIFKLPANVKGIQCAMTETVKRPRRNTVTKIAQQAERTAWKLLLDWVQVQTSMVVIGRRNIIEVFLPYAYDMRADMTLFDKLQGNGFKMLESGDK